MFNASEVEVPVLLTKHVFLLVTVVEGYKLVLN